MAIGNYAYHKNAEILNTQSNIWSSINSYPYDLELIILIVFFLIFASILVPVKATSFLARAPIIYVDGAFYVIGGLGATNQNVIGRLDATTKIWSKSGELVNGRYGHRAIFDGASILVVGGEGTKKTENCAISKGQITCFEQDQELYNYNIYPELFLIPANFCRILL